ncbi:hypothetical protein QBC34DRAFT_24369 [Podospora aff. communis PSN243]|uniref:Uncharacterized protein n=1 Tax=Podospora aff. communis PSN243 TaxID=3040156 RepID=A0AAV9G5H7_9PEZI|nr:hypothetical protein QBC34DRAFT_24369 [Podospora aff. communis PSN243]
MLMWSGSRKETFEMRLAVAGLALACLVRVALANNDTIACPVWNSRLSFASHMEPHLPFHMRRSECLVSKSKEFSRDGAHTFVTLHQTEEAWQHDARRDSVLAEVEEAINVGLDLFGDHAGSLSRPLHIHATLALVQTDWWKIDLDVLAQTDTKTDNITISANPSTCYLAIGFHQPAFNFSLTSYKKEIVNQMYHCVVRYHHPALDFGWQWWITSIARFFDGLAWPATPDMWTQPFRNIYRGYPEDYNAWEKLMENDQSSALFWHAVHNAGWTTREISHWMANRTHPLSHLPFTSEHQILARDPRFCDWFHEFGRKLGDGRIFYPSTGEKMDLSRVYEEKLWMLWGFPIGSEESPVTAPADWLLPMNVGHVDPWVVVHSPVAFRGGQEVNATLGYRNWKERNGRLRWSYKRADEEESLEMGKGGDWKLITVPGTSETVAWYNFTVTTTAITRTADEGYVDLEVILV